MNNKVNAIIVNNEQQDIESKIDQALLSESLEEVKECLQDVKEYIGERADALESKISSISVGSGGSSSSGNSSNNVRAYFNVPCFGIDDDGIINITSSSFKIGAKTWKEYVEENNLESIYGLESIAPIFDTSDLSPSKLSLEMTGTFSSFTISIKYGTRYGSNQKNIAISIHTPFGVIPCVISNDYY